MKRYPRRGSVSTNRGLSASSPSAARSRLTAALRLCSKSTKVPLGHRREQSSSRVTTWPGRSSIIRRISNGCSWSRTQVFPFRSSRERTSSSNGPKRSVSVVSGDPFMAVRAPGDWPKIDTRLPHWEAFEKRQRDCSSHTDATGHLHFTSCHLRCIEAPARRPHSGGMRFPASVLAVAILATAPAAAAEIDPDMRVVVRTYNTSHLPDADLESAVTTATAILRGSGFELTWRACDEAFVRNAAAPLRRAARRQRVRGAHCQADNRRGVPRRAAARILARRHRDAVGRAGDDLYRSRGVAGRCRRRGHPARCSGEPSPMSSGTSCSAPTRIRRPD